MREAKEFLEYLKRVKMEFKDNRTAARMTSELLAEKGLDDGLWYMYGCMRGEIDAYDIVLKRMEDIIMGFKAYAKEDLMGNVEEKEHERDP